jgi:hypothetical protein
MFVGEIQHGGCLGLASRVLAGICHRRAEESCQCCREGWPENETVSDWRDAHRMRMPPRPERALRSADPPALSRLSWNGFTVRPCPGAPALPFAATPEDKKAYTDPSLRGALAVLTAPSARTRARP